MNLIEKESLICIFGSMIQDKAVGVTSIHFEEGWCLLIIPTWLILLPCILDVISSIFVLYLFIRVLKKLLNINVENISNTKKLLGIAQLMSKLILLTLIAVLSNLFGGLWFAVTDIALFTYMDTVINPICLILMEAQHKDLYRFFCKYCHIGMHRMIHRKHVQVALIPFIEMIDEKKEKDKNNQSENTEKEITVWEKSEETKTTTTATATTTTAPTANQDGSGAKVVWEKQIEPTMD